MNELLSTFEPQWAQFIRQEMTTDGAHDLAHVQRVVHTAKQLCNEEQATMEVVVAAAWLHDCFTFAKNHPQRQLSSQYAADKAIHWLQQHQYPSCYLEAIHHAICAHSYSADITPTTIEAKIVQDADRLDGLGAIGIARCIMTGASFESALYATDDPFCRQRTAQDKAYIIDHFYSKLFATVETMNTASGHKEALRRKAFMDHFLTQLASEI